MMRFKSNNPKSTLKPGQSILATKQILGPRLLGQNPKDLSQVYKAKNSEKNRLRENSVPGAKKVSFNSNLNNTRSRPKNNDGKTQSQRLGATRKLNDSKEIELSLSATAKDNLLRLKLNRDEISLLRNINRESKQQKVD